jgi:O-antigen ligase
MLRLLWLRGAEMTGRLPSLQAEQTVNAPWFVPGAVGALALALTWWQAQLGLPLLIAATALNRYRFELAGGGFRIEHFVFVGVTAAWLARVRPGWARFGFSRADLLLVGYLGAALVSCALFAPAPQESLKFLGLMAFGVALYWVVQAMSAEAGEFARGVAALIAVGVAASLFGILAWAAYPLGISLGVQTYALGSFETYSPYGTLFDSNTLGLYAMAAALLQVTLALDAEFARWRGWLGAGIVITLIAVALSLTRAAWLGLVFGLLLVALLSARQKWALAIGGGAAALVALALIANSALAGGGGALAEFSVARVLTSQSIFFRLDAYTRAWNDFLASPWLGNGVNVFGQKYTAPSGTRDWISNFFLMTLHDTGLVGLALVLVWLGWLAYETRRALARARGTMRTLLLGLTIAYLALFLTYQATTVFWLGFNWVYLGLLRGGGRGRGLAHPNPPLVTGRE